MTTPPWGHKPPPVDDPERYWCDPPPEVSPRLLYWVSRYFGGTWIPNKRLRAECGQCQADMLGIYYWEAYNIMYPLERAYERKVLGRG